MKKEEEQDEDVRITYKFLHYYGESEYDKGAIMRKIATHKLGTVQEHNDTYYKYYANEPSKDDKFKLDITTQEDLMKRGISDVVFFMEDTNTEYWFYTEDIPAYSKKSRGAFEFDRSNGWTRKKFL